MKYVFLCVICFLLFSTAVALPEDVKTININLPSENISTVVHWFTEVKFDSTYNIVYLNISEPYDFVIHGKNLFHIWGFNVEKNGKPELFNLRPFFQENKTNYIFNYSLNPDGGFAFYKISFWMNDVRPERSEFWYPFDEYSVVRNHIVPDSEGYYTYYEFPNVDIEIGIEDTGNCQSKNVPNFSISQQAGIVIKTQNKRIPIEVVLQNSELEAVKIKVYETILDVPVRSYKVLFDECPESHYINFRRSIFPAQLLFGMLLAFLTLTTIKHRGEPLVVDRLYRIYVDSSLFILFAEFTASILPPSRPLTLTLFDGIIVWPIILLGGMSILARVKKKLEKKGEGG